MEDEVVSYGRRLTELATQRSDERALTVVSPEAEEHLTWRELDARSNQLARVFTGRGVLPGGRVALEIPNSVGLVLGVLAAWKAGAVPVPMRWDLPEWERSRLVEVVAPALLVDAPTLDDLLGEAEGAPADPLPERISPQINGICSSGSTGLPKVIMSARPAVWTEAVSEPFINNWREVPRPQTICVLGPMYHTNGFAQLSFLLGGDRLVVLSTFDASLAVDVIERHRVSHITATPTMLQRIAQVPDVEERDLSSIEWILQGLRLTANFTRLTQIKFTPIKLLHSDLLERLGGSQIGRFERSKKWVVPFSAAKFQAP